MVIAMMITMMILMLYHDDNEQRMKFINKGEGHNDEVDGDTDDVGKDTNKGEGDGDEVHVPPTKQGVLGAEYIQSCDKKNCEKFTMTMRTITAITMIIMMITIDLDCSWRQK